MKSIIHVIRVKKTHDFLWAVQTEGMPLRIGRTISTPSFVGLNRPGAPLQTGATIFLETEENVTVNP